MSTDPELSPVVFEPLRPASRRRMLVGIVVGPLLWLVSLIVVAAVLHKTYAIELGLLIAFASAVVSTVGLLLFRRDRIRQEKRYAAGS